MSNDFNVIEEGKETPDKKKMKIMIIKNDSESKKMLEDSIIELKKWPVRLFWILIIIFSVISIIGLIIDRNIFTNTTAIIFLIIAGALFVLDFLKKGIITRYINLISRIKKIVREREENQKREIEKIKSAEQQLEISYDHKVEELEQAHSMRTQELESAYNEKTLILEQDFSRKSVELSNLDKKRAISSKMTLFLRFSQIIPTLSSFSEIISIENIDPNNLQDIFLKISEKSGKELPVVEALYQIFESGTMRRVTWEGLKSKEIYRRQFIDSLFQTKKLSAEARDIDPRIFDKLLEQLLDVASFLEEINQNIEILIKISREIQIFEKFCEEEECTFESFALWNDLYDVQKQLIPFKSNLLILFLNIIENRLHPVDEPTFELVIAKLISFVYVSRIYPEKKKEICEEFSKSDEFTAILWDYSNNKNHFKKLGNYINENEKKFSLIIEKLVKTNLFPFYKKKVSEGIIYENNQELIGAYVDARSREADIEFLYGTLLTEGHEFTLLNALKEFFALHLDFVTFLQGLILNKGIKLYLVTFRSKEGSLSKIIDSIIHLDAFGSENHKYDSTEYYNLWRYTDSARIGILAKDVTFADFENRLSTEIRDKIDEK